MSRTTTTVLTTAAAALAAAGAMATPALAATHSASPVSRTTATRVTVGHARMTLPKGWVATKASANAYGGGWCLHSAKDKACTIRYSEAPLSLAVNTEIQGGYDADPQYCGPGKGNGPLTRGTVTSWGGRQAEYRRWDIRCGKKNGPTVIQYVAPSWPTSVLFAETSRANANAVDATMRQIVGSSSLPRQARPARLMDVGYLRSVTKVKGGTRITVDRVVLDGRGGAFNSSPRTYTYTIPSAVRTSSLKVGKMVWVRTDGYKVTAVY